MIPELSAVAALEAPAPDVSSRCHIGAGFLSDTRLTLRVDFGASRSIGPGKIRLLEAIDRTGSISRAGRALGMGLYDEVLPKLVLCKTGRDCAFALLRGQAEIGIPFTSEFIAVPGTRVVGTFPADIAYVNGYAGAIPKDAAVDPARAFLTFLASPSSKECFKSFGLE